MFLPPIILPLFALSFFPTQFLASANEFVAVQTTTGKVQGRRVWGKADMDVFLGIPYAKPPLGPLRFEKTAPLTAEGPNRTIDATRMPKVCVPHHRLDNWTLDWDEYSEDCLFLNVFCAHQKETKKTNGTLKPMLVLIYVGGFEAGSMRRYKNWSEIGQKFVVKGIVVAAIQFRIGFFGFASSGDSEMPGNYGFWDMAEALRWLRANAATFGADPDRITLFGYSASSSSVTALGLSPHSSDLFHQSIQMSGPVFTARGASDRTVSSTQKLADQIGCGHNGPKMKECFKEKSVDQFLGAMDNVGSTVSDVNYDLFGPTFDGDFLPADHFGQLVSKAKPKRTILGITELDPLAYALITGNNSLRHLAIDRADFATFGPDQFREYLRANAMKNEYFGAEADKLTDEVVEFYTNSEFGQKHIVGDNWFFLQKIVEFLADVQFRIPLMWEVQAKVSSRWPLYLYMHKYVNARRIPIDFPTQLHKSFHDNDHQYVLRHPYSDYAFDKDDLKIEQMMAEMVANFVLDGDPSLPNSVRWHTVTQDSPFQHLEIALPFCRFTANNSDFDIRQMAFWERMIQKYPKYNLILGKRAVINSADGIANANLFWLSILPLIALYFFS